VSLRIVMAGLVPAIHVFTLRQQRKKESKTWITGTSPAMTTNLEYLSGIKQ